MQNTIFIEEDKKFTLDEFAHLVARAIRSLAAAEIGDAEIVYPRDDVYWTIVDVIGFINERTPGSFKLTQTSFEKYHIHYTPPQAAEKKAKRNLVVSKAQSALTIKEASGRLPVWAETDPEVMSSIEAIQAKQNTKTEASGAARRNTEERERVDRQIENRAEFAIKHYRQFGSLPNWASQDKRILAHVLKVLKTENVAEVQHV